MKSYIYYVIHDGNDLTLTFNAVAPAITSTNNVTFYVGYTTLFTVTAAGNPVPTLSTAGLPVWASFNLTNGTLIGTPPNAANAPFTVTLTAANGISPNARQNLTLSVIQPFSQWEAHYSVTGGATATPQNDGVPNLVKYLADINPTQPMSALDLAALPAMKTTTISGTPYLMLTYRQYAAITGITVNVQTSPDLQTWTTVTPTSTPISDTVQQTGTDPNTGDPILQAQVPVSGPRQFIRLNVTAP